MKKAKWILVWILLASLALGLAACGGEAETAEMAGAPQAEPATATPLPPTATPLPTDTPEPTATPEEAGALDLGEIEAPSDLSSYRASMGISISGTDEGEAVDGHLSFLIEYTREPPAMRIVMSAEGIEDTEGMGSIEMYQVEDMAYLNFGEQWLSVPATEDLLSEIGFFEPEDILQDTCGWNKEGDTEYNGIRVHHWTASKEDMEACMTAEELADIGQITSASGDVYIAVEGNYVVHMNMVFEGQNLEAGLGTEDQLLDEGRMELTFDLTDVNQPFVIELPEEAVAAGSLPEDIPIPDDAQEVANAFGMITFSSPSTPAEVADFYQAQMPQAGWSEVSVDDLSGMFMMEYSKDGRTASLVISADEDTGMTSVLITIQEEEG